MSTTPESQMTRRSFVRRSSLAAIPLAFPAILRSQGANPRFDRLNVALIGVGGRGSAPVNVTASENVLAFCDVDEVRAAPAFEKHPDVPRYKDYRRMLDRLGDQIDAVTISTPDHMHYPIVLAAMQLGKHVFVEKPLAHTITEARHMRKLAEDNPKLQTQMGNQGHSGEGIRLFKEWFEAGVLGEVREVHAWTNRPSAFWPQGGLEAPDHSAMRPVVPSTLDWDAWLGVAAARPYDPAYVPFNWRGYWDFGTGALGDMGCHILDGAHWVLNLDAPSRITPVSAQVTDVGGPSAAMTTFEFPARGALPPLRLNWYEGYLQPPLPTEFEVGRSLPPSGSLIVGSKATVLVGSHYQSIRIIPEVKMREIAPTLPAKTIPRVKGGGIAEWIRACKGGPIAGSNFSVSTRLTELCLLSNVAVRAGRAIDWDADAMAVTNFPEANRYLTKEYRPGFGL